MVTINATIWYEIYVDSQHRTIDEYFYKKLLEVFPSCDKPIKQIMYARKEAVRGGAPPHKSHLIGTATRGRILIGPFKMDTKALLACWLPRALLENFGFVSSGALQKRPQPLTSGRPFNHDLNISLSI